MSGPGSSSLSSLPQELLVKVFKNLKTKDLKKVARVNSVCHSICQPLLFTRLGPRDYRGYESYENSPMRNLERHMISAFAFGRESLTKYVRHLTLTAFDDTLPQQLEPNHFTLLCLLSRQLRSLQLHELCIDKNIKVPASELADLDLSNLMQLDLVDSVLRRSSELPLRLDQLKSLRFTCTNSGMNFIPTGLTSLSIGCANCEHYDEGPGCTYNLLEKTLKANPQIKIVDTFRWNGDGITTTHHADVLTMIKRYSPGLQALSLDADIKKYYHYGVERGEEETAASQLRTFEYVEVMVARMTSLQSLRLSVTVNTLWSESRWAEFHAQILQHLTTLQGLRQLSLEIKAFTNSPLPSSTAVNWNSVDQLGHAAAYAAAFPSLSYLCMREVIQKYHPVNEVEAGAFYHFIRQDGSTAQIEKLSRESAQYRTVEASFKDNDVVH